MWGVKNNMLSKSDEYKRIKNGEIRLAKLLKNRSKKANKLLEKLIKWDKIYYNRYGNHAIKEFKGMD